MLGILLGVAASMSWASASFVSARPLKVIPVPLFSLLRFTLVGSVFLAISVQFFGFSNFSRSELGLLVASGVIGIAFGETLLYKAIKEIGVQKGLIAFSLNIPITALLAVSFDERVASISLLLGAALATTAVILAVLVRTKDATEPELKPNRFGYAAGLGAAVGQSVGLIFTKAAVSQAHSIFAVSCIRALSAAAIMICIVLATKSVFTLSTLHDKAVARDTILSTFLSSGLGLFFANMALQHGDAAIVASCLSLSPVFAVLLGAVGARNLPDWQIFASVGCLALGLYLLSR